MAPIQSRAVPMASGQGAGAVAAAPVAPGCVGAFPKARCQGPSRKGRRYTVWVASRKRALTQPEVPPARTFIQTP